MTWSNTEVNKCKRSAKQTSVLLSISFTLIANHYLDEVGFPLIIS